MLLSLKFVILIAQKSLGATFFSLFLILLSGLPDMGSPASSVYPVG